MCVLIFGTYLLCKENKEDKKNITTQELDISSSLVQDLSKMINPSNEGSLISELYTEKALSNSYILAVGAMNYIRKNVSKESEAVKKLMLVVNIPDEDLKQSIYEIFGEVNYEKENFYVFNHEYGVCGFTYNKELDQFESLNGCDGTEGTRISRKIISARKENNHIYIVEKTVFIYADFGINDTIDCYIYSDFNKKNLIAYIKTDRTKGIPLSIEPYIEHASSYEYIFEKIGDHYIFKEIKKI